MRFITAKRPSLHGVGVWGTTGHPPFFLRSCLLGDDFIAADIFDIGHKSRKQNEAQVDNLFRQIGQLKVENDFYPKSSVFKQQVAEADGGPRGAEPEHC